MKTTATRETVLQAIATINEKLGYQLSLNRDDYQGKYFSFTLKTPSKVPGARISHSGRNLAKASWHAHGYVFDAIFALDPKAVIYSCGTKITALEGNWQDITGSFGSRPFSSLSIHDKKKEAKYGFNEKDKYVKTDGWRGYSQPVHAVAGANNTGSWSDSPCPSDLCQSELTAIKRHLAENGIPTREVVRETSNVFCVHVYLISYPHQTKQARKLVKAYLENNETRLAYVA